MRSSSINTNAYALIGDWAMLAGAADPQEILKRPDKRLETNELAADPARVASLRQHFVRGMTNLLEAIDSSNQKWDGETAEQCLQRIWRTQKVDSQAAQKALAAYEQYPAGLTMTEIAAEVAQLEKRTCAAVIAADKTLATIAEEDALKSEDGTAHTIAAEPLHA